MSDTPETDAKLVEGRACGAAHLEIVPAHFARSLERRLQEAHDSCDRYAEQLQAALREVASLQMALDAVVDAVKEGRA